MVPLPGLSINQSCKIGRPCCAHQIGLETAKQKKLRRTAAPSASVCARRKKSNGCTSISISLGPTKRDTPGKGVHPEKGMRGDASCRQSRDRYNPYRLRYGHARFFVPFFPLFIIIAYLSLPAQGVYIFYNSWFRFLGETSIPHTFSWEESPCIKRLDSPSLQSYIPPVFRQTESPVLEITTLRLLLLFTRTSELITVTHRKPCPPCPTVSPGHDKCDKINWYTDIVSSIACTALPSLLQSTIPIVHHMIRRNSNAVTVNMGRGAYDTTGTLKPGQPPPPKPR